jgi:hypothetical protein
MSTQLKRLNSLRDNNQSCLIIHYSCEGLSDDRGFSPRINSIVVYSLKNAISYSFSIHLEAEIGKIDKENTEDNFDKLEKKMLQKFYKFVEKNNDSVWLHWNMRSVHYGFEMLEHRYKFLMNSSKLNICTVPQDRRFNICDMIIDIYGNNCVDAAGRMQKLMELNGGEPKGFLNGKQEALAFKNKEYVKLHESTLSKVEWFREIFLLLLKRKIKTQHNNWKSRINDLFDSSFMRILVIMAIVYVFYSILRY